jgi:hypothetical protein
MDDRKIYTAKGRREYSNGIFKKKGTVKKEIVNGKRKISKPHSRRSNKS